MIRSLGKLQLGDPEPLEFATFGTRGGLNVYDPPQEIGDEDLTIALDGYLVATGDGLGGFMQRNGMNSYNSNTTPANSLILARFYQDVKNGAAVSPETLKLLGQIGNTLYTIPSGSGAFSSVGDIHSGGVAAAAMVTARIQNPNDPNFPSGLTDCTVICTGSGGPYVYDGTNLYTPAGWSNAASAQWCAVVNGVLWFGGIKTAPNQVFGAGDGITASMETLPGYRNFVLSSPVTGLCGAGSGPNASLVIGCNGGLSVLYGTGPSTFYRQDIPFGDGVAAGRTMISPDGTVYFLGHNAVYVFDLVSTPKILSKKIEPWILNSPFVGGSPMTQNRNLSWACVYNNRYHLGYCSSSATPNVVLCYDLIVGGWTLLRPATGVASMILLDAPADASPYVALVGTATTAQAMTWDFVPSDPTKGAYDDAPTNTVAVLAQCQGKNFRLGVPGSTKCLTRFYPEMFIAGPFMGQLVVSVDSGNVTTAALVNSSSYTGSAGAVWDTSAWDSAAWGGTANLVRFGPPYSRADFQVQGSEFAFGIKTTSAQPPWLYTGGTGAYQQQGRP